ncbi:MAG: hypothetical protein FJY85_04600 [Deltaproteobacteria bacterium]|nr:hypothetical protein [Deltaproteobacteria bacterium]
MEYVDQLWHLVNLQLAQEPPHAADAGVVLLRNARPPAGRVGHHGAELVEGERLAPLANAGGMMEDGAGGVDFDCHDHGQPEGQGDKDDQKGDNEVEGAFEHGGLRLKGQNALAFLKADLESLKDARSSQQVKANTQFLGESHPGNEPFRSYLDFELMQIHRNETAIPNLQIDPIPSAVIEADAISNLSTEYGISGS